VTFGGLFALVVLTAIGTLGCNSGRVSIGDDTAPLCTPDDCGEAPAEAVMCLNGRTGRFACESRTDDSCSWVVLCPELSCSLDDCGPPPAEPPMCPVGMWGTAWACESVASPCSWSTVCPGDMRECSLMDCGPPPLDATECATGGMQGSSCLRNSSGTCSWTPVACRPS
jgi:hypothetical protein